MHDRVTRASAASTDWLPALRAVPRRIMSVWSGILFGTGFLVSVAVLVLGAFLALRGSPGQSVLAYGLLGLNLALIVLLGAYLTVRLVALLSRRAGQAAPILHRRFVLIFSLVALAPAILVGVFAASLLTQNIDDIFGDDVRSNLDQARGILDSYIQQELVNLNPKLEVVRTAIARDSSILDSRISLTALMGQAARQLDLDSVYVLHRDGRVLARVEGPDTPELRVPVADVFEAVRESGRTGLQSRNEIDYLMALAPLSPGTAGESGGDTYLYVGDYLRQNAGVLSSIEGINQAGDNLSRFNSNTARFNRTFFLTFVETAMLVLMAAILIGTFLANRIIEPLGRMILASERVRDGDLAARVAVDNNWGEISDLSGAFNRMTEQLSSQRAELVQEHAQSERQRRFSEAVLSGVTAGVVGLSEEGRITVVNRSAELLLGRSRTDLTGRPVSEAVPGFATAFGKARESLAGRADDQVELDLDGEPHTFDLRVSSYEGERQDTGWVLTFDDMTRLVAAQRQGAWREVARRIAHEIKNPLTPIQLAAERLQRKLGDAEMGEPERAILHRSTDTILRSVANLERMVDEFSSLARMPQPTFDVVDLTAVVDAAVTDQDVAFSDIKIIRRGEVRRPVIGDARLLGQAISNLIKNAAEATGRASDTGLLREGGARVAVHLLAVADSVVVEVRDNGEGWPDVSRERLLEPYTTTRQGGTGLGLAIVKRIVEDHGGRVELDTRADGKRGAVFRLVLPLAGSLATTEGVAA